MPKVNVYLPDELATQVKALGIMVSPVCQKALDREVKNARLQRSVRDDERLAKARERLREPAHMTFTAYEMGMMQGREWALEEAPLAELRGIARAVASADWGMSPFEIRTETYPWASAWILEFLRSIRGPGMTDEQLEEFDRGFAESAAETMALIEAGM